MNIAKAKAELSALIEAAMAGDDVVLARAGTPLVRLVSLKGPPKSRLGGLRDYGWTHETPYDAFGPEPEYTAELEADGPDPAA